MIMPTIHLWPFLKLIILTSATKNMIQTTETAIKRQSTFFVTYVRSGISYKWGSIFECSVKTDNYDFLPDFFDFMLNY